MSSPPFGIDGTYFESDDVQEFQQSKIITMLDDSVENGEDEDKMRKKCPNCRRYSQMFEAKQQEVDLLEKALAEIEDELVEQRLALREEDAVTFEIFDQSKQESQPTIDKLNFSVDVCDERCCSLINEADNHSTTTMIKDNEASTVTDIHLDCEFGKEHDISRILLERENQVLSFSLNYSKTTNSGFPDKSSGFSIACIARSFV